MGRLELDKYEFIEEPEALIKGLREVNKRVDIFTFLQRPVGNSPEYEYPMIWDNLAVLTVSTFDYWWNHQIRSEPRNRARQAAKKGVEVCEVEFDDALIHGIWELYNESPIRQGTRFRHYGRDLEWVRKHAGTHLDRSIFLGAFLGAQLIGFIKLVTDKAQTQACMMHILSMIKHRDKAPTNALVAQAVRSCADRGVRYLVYQNFFYGKKRADSLSRFKEINGFQCIDVRRYYVPLTPVGRIAVALRLHRKLIDRLPQSAGTVLRDLRKNWYSFRFRSQAEG